MFCGKSLLTIFKKTSKLSLSVNGQYRGDSAIGRLMHDFCCCDPDDMEHPLMRETTKYYKENPKGVEIMCRAFEEVRDESARRRAEDIAVRMIEEDQFSFELISKMTED